MNYDNVIDWLLGFVTAGGILWAARIAWLISFHGVQRQCLQK